MIRRVFRELFEFVARTGWEEETVDKVCSPVDAASNRVCMAQATTVLSYRQGCGRRSFSCCMTGPSGRRLLSQWPRSPPRLPNQLQQVVTRSAKK
jgi:hypothetical protein